MTLRRLVAAGLGAALLATTASLTLADEKASAKDALGHYYPIRAALAGDQTEDIKDHAQALAKYEDKEIAKAAQALAKASDLAAARKAFGDVSKALIAHVEKDAKAGEDVGTVYVFECPMAKPYGRWAQADEDMGNPYMGTKMPKCGKHVATIGKEEKKKDGHDHGHK